MQVDLDEAKYMNFVMLAKTVINMIVDHIFSLLSLFYHSFF